MPILWKDCLVRESSLLDQACPAGAEFPRAGERSRAVASLSPWVRSYPLTHEQRLGTAAAERAGRSASTASRRAGCAMASNLLASACDVLGIKDNRRAERSAHLADDDRPAGTMAHRRCAVVRCGPQNPERWISNSAYRSEPLEVVVDPIDDRDPTEANSLLPRHVAVAVP